MAGISHVFQSTIADGADTTLVRPSNWNADHTITGTIAPATSDIAALGSTSLMWSDLFLASGAVTNYANGNVTVTHSSTVLTQTGAYKADSLYDATYRVGYTLLTSGSASNAATIDIVLTNYSAYRAIVLQLNRLIPATDSSALWMRFSTDGGSTFTSGASDYVYAYNVVTSAPANSPAGSGGDTKIIMLDTVSANGTLGVIGSVNINSYTSANRTHCFWQFHSGRAGGGTHSVYGGARCDVAQDTDAVRLLMSSGNISADYALYGAI